jgi:hypothetical protein
VYEDNPDDDPDQPPFIPTSRQTFGNTAQSASFTCPDGSLFTYTVPAGTFIQFSQLQADTVALTYAQSKVILTRICVGSLIADSVCVGSEFEATVTVSASQTPIVVFTYSGTLPPGITYTYDDESITFSGTPTAAGQYDFVLQVEDPDGNFMRKAFTILVATIANSSPLPGGTVGVAYSQTLTIDGPIVDGPLWTYTGTLPPGLTLNTTTGVISGTPTTGGTYSFTIEMEDGH